MRTWIFLPCVLLAAVSAEDLVTTDGKTYRGVTIRKVEPDGLAIVHESGTAKVPFKVLPADVQAQHGYDPLKAEAHAKAEAAKQAAAEKQIGQAVQAKLDAIPWEKRFAFEPATKDGLYLLYVPFGEMDQEARTLAARENRTKEELATELAKIPKGGVIFGVINRTTIEAANDKYFTILVLDHQGKELAKRTGDFDTPEVPEGDGLWTNLLGVEMPRPLRAGDQVRVVDRLHNSHVDFTVKAR